MTHSYRTFVRSGVSTKPGQVQFEIELHSVVEHLCDYEIIDEDDET